MVEAAVNAAAPRRRRLWVIWSLFALLLAGIVLNEWRGESHQQHAAAVDEHGHAVGGPEMLLPMPIEDVRAIEIYHNGVLHRFERDAGNAWFYHGTHKAADATHAHSIDPLLTARIAKAFDGFGRTRRERELRLEQKGKDFGVSAPQMIILVYQRVDAAPLAQYAVGDLAPDRLSRYVLRMGADEVVTIANYQIENLLGLLSAVALPPAPAGGGSS